MNDGVLVDFAIAAGVPALLGLLNSPSHGGVVKLYPKFDSWLSLQFVKFDCTVMTVRPF